MKFLMAFLFLFLAMEMITRSVDFNVSVHKLQYTKYQDSEDIENEKPKSKTFLLKVIHLLGTFIGQSKFGFSLTRDEREGDVELALIEGIFNGNNKIRGPRGMFCWEKDNCNTYNHQDFLLLILIVGSVLFAMSNQVQEDFNNTLEDMKLCMCCIWEMGLKEIVENVSVSIKNIWNIVGNITLCLKNIFRMAVNRFQTVKKDKRKSSDHHVNENQSIVIVIIEKTLSAVV